MRRWKEAGGPGWDHSVAGFKKKKSQKAKNSTARKKQKLRGGLLFPLCPALLCQRLAGPAGELMAAGTVSLWGQAGGGGCRVLARGLSAPSPSPRRAWWALCPFRSSQRPSLHPHPTHMGNGRSDRPRLLSSGERMQDEGDVG